MDDLAQQSRADPDRVLEQRIEGPPDLVHLHHSVRIFLSDVHEHAVTDAALVVVMLTGDAIRHGTTPVMLRLRRSPDHDSLRVEVADHRAAGVDPAAEDYRITLLDRMTTARGVKTENGTTTTWAEIPLIPTTAR